MCVCFFVPCIYLLDIPRRNERLQEGTPAFTIFFNPSATLAAKKKKGNGMIHPPEGEARNFFFFFSDHI